MTDLGEELHAIADRLHRLAADSTPTPGAAQGRRGLSLEFAQGQNGSLTCEVAFGALPRAKPEHGHSETRTVRGMGAVLLQAAVLVSHAAEGCCTVDPALLQCLSSTHWGEKPDQSRPKDDKSFSVAVCRLNGDITATMCSWTSAHLGNTGKSGLWQRAVAAVAQKLLEADGKEDHLLVREKAGEPFTVMLGEGLLERWEDNLDRLPADQSWRSIFQRWETHRRAHGLTPQWIQVGEHLLIRSGWDKTRVWHRVLGFQLWPTTTLVDALVSGTDNLRAEAGALFAEPASRHIKPGLESGSTDLAGALVAAVQMANVEAWLGEDHQPIQGSCPTLQTLLALWTAAALLMAERPEPASLDLAYKLLRCGLASLLGEATNTEIGGWATEWWKGCEGTPADLDSALRDWSGRIPGGAAMDATGD